MTRRHVVGPLFVLAVVAASRSSAVLAAPLASGGAPDSQSSIADTPPPAVDVTPMPPDVVVTSANRRVAHRIRHHGDAERVVAHSPSTARRPRYIPNPRLERDFDNGYCLVVDWRIATPTDAEAAAAEQRLSTLRDQYPLCNGAKPTAPAKPDPAGAAEAAWRDTKTLPRPTVWMAPGKAITGLEGCLEIGGPSTMPIDYPDVFGIAIHIDAATTRYLIDWGDGTTTETTDRGGACDKGGRLRHTYQYKGNRTITVTQRWSAAWSSGSASGTVADTLATVGTLGLEVFEIQPVIVNPTTEP